MLNGVVLSLTILLSLSDLTLGRTFWAERDGMPVFLHPRRFGQEQPAVLNELRNACPGQVCGVLAGQAVAPLLAAQPECSQQDMADQIIDESKQFDAETQKNMLEIAKKYRQAEKNTPPDFSTNPPTPRNSVFCQKAPKNKELDCLVQAQDPANKDVFFDPATKKSVQRGSQRNTAPFCQSASLSDNGNNPENDGNNPENAGNDPENDGNNPENNGNNPENNGNNPENNNPDAKGGNLQTFTGTLGAPAPTVTATGDGQFQVQDNALFKDQQNAIRRSCDVQKNKCANAANSSGNKGNLTVAACEKQQQQCLAAAT